MTPAGAPSDGADGVRDGVREAAGRPDSVPARWELALLGAFSVAWALAALLGFGVLPGAGLLHLDLYSLYGLAAALGWVAGNVYVARRSSLRDAPERVRRRGRLHLLFVYLVGPPSVVYVLRALAPLVAQNAAPFVPLYAFGVYGIFFLVPVTLK